MQFINEFLKSWRKSTAEKISFWLFIASLIMAIIAFMPYGFFDENTTNNINNVLIGLATNMIGIIITISFVQYFLDIQKTKNEREEEEKLLIRSYRSIKFIIDRYTIYFYRITTPFAKDQDDEFILKEEFSFEDMCDMHYISASMYDHIFDSSISLFFKQEYILRESFLSILNHNQLKYNNAILEILSQFLEQSFENDFSGFILGMDKGQFSEKRHCDQFIRMIKESGSDYIKRYNNEDTTLESNGILPYIRLYFLLKEEAKLINKFKTEMEKLVMKYETKQYDAV